MITFIIPSKGRPTLANTIQSLYCQQSSDWNACVCFDDVDPTLQTYDKIRSIRTNKKLGQGHNSAGEVRNFAIDHMYSSGLLHNWIGFVDDDDTLSHWYTANLESTVENLKIVNCEPDVVVYRMRYTDKTVLPPEDFNKMQGSPVFEEDMSKYENKIGISFAIRSQLFRDGLRFEASSGEDFNFLKQAQICGAKIYISPHVMYNVAPLGCPKDRL